MNLTELDLFRKIPKDFTKGTKSGALFSLAAIGLMLLLFFLELASYLRGKIDYSVTMDDNTDPQIRVSIRVQMYELPCEFAQLDIYDYLGVNRLDVQQNVFKNRIAGPSGERFLGFYENKPKIMHEAHHDPNKVASLDLSRKDFMSHLEQRGDRYSFVNFYANWCSHCQRLAPTWEAFAEEVLRRNMDVAIYKVDCVHQAQVCQDQRIMGYPTLRLFKGTKIVTDDYMGDRTVAAFLAHLETNTGVHAAAAFNANNASERIHKVEGCIISARLDLNRVPGNIRIHARSDAHDIEPLATNVSHTIQNLGFGATDNQGHILTHLPRYLAPNTNPLDGKSFVNTQGFLSHDHYLKVVSTRYIKTGFPSKVVQGYQLTVASHMYENAPQIPEVKISFDLSPTAIVLTDAGRKKWYEFLTNVCALVGGIYTVISLMDTAFYATMRRVSKDNQGKLQ